MHKYISSTDSFMLSTKKCFCRRRLCSIIKEVTQTSFLNSLIDWTVRNRIGKSTNLPLLGKRFWDCKRIGDKF